MSLAEVAAADFGTMLETFGESVTHHPLGNSQHAAELTAIVFLEPPGNNNSRSVQVERHAGRQEEHIGEIYLPVGAATLDPTDKWILGDAAYTVLAISKPEAGRVRISLNRNESLNRTTDFGRMVNR